MRARPHQHLYFCPQGQKCRRVPFGVPRIADILSDICFFIYLQKSLKSPVAVPGECCAGNAGLHSADRCHSLSSLHLPPAALASLPLSVYQNSRYLLWYLLFLFFRLKSICRYSIIKSLTLSVMLRERCQYSWIRFRRSTYATAPKSKDPSFCYRTGDRCGFLFGGIHHGNTGRCYEHYR